MSDLAVIVPSRGRPQNVWRLLEAWALTVGDSDDVATELWLVVDYDDPCRHEYLALEAPAGVSFDIREALPRRRLGPALNFAGRDLAHRVPMLGFLGDDHLPRTYAWDEEVVTALRSLGSGIVYGDDLHQGERLPTAVFMTSDVVRTLGYMCPPGLDHMFLDDAWKAWGEGMGRLRYLPGVVIEHLHPDAGKAPEDELYLDVWALTSPDSERWQEYRIGGELAADVEKLRGLC